MKKRTMPCKYYTGTIRYVRESSAVLCEILVFIRIFKGQHDKREENKQIVPKVCYGNSGTR